MMAPKTGANYQLGSMNFTKIVYLDITLGLLGTERRNFTKTLEFEFLVSWSRKKTETRISWFRNHDFEVFQLPGMQSSDTTIF